MNEHWQFSLRGMFVLTAIVALCLGAGYYFPKTVLVIVALGLIQAAFGLAAEWLIQRRNRRALALTPLATWGVLASGLIAFGGWQLFGLFGTTSSQIAWIFAVSLLAAGAFCAFLAFIR